MTRLLFNGKMKATSDEREEMSKSTELRIFGKEEKEEEEVWTRGIFLSFRFTRCNDGYWRHGFSNKEQGKPLQLKTVEKSCRLLWCRCAKWGRRRKRELWYALCCLVSPLVHPLSRSLVLILTVSPALCRSTARLSFPSFVRKQEEKNKYLDWNSLFSMTESTSKWI